MALEIRRSTVFFTSVLLMVLNFKCGKWELCVTFSDYEKAFDSLDQQSLWKLLRHCGIPEIPSINRNSYGGMTC